MAFVDIEIEGLERIKGKLEDLQVSLFTKKVTSEIGLFIMTKVKIRTLAGEDADGIKFAPYSEHYKKIRRKAGRPTNKVDLFFTGSMQSSMTFDSDTKKVDVYFLNTEDEKGVKNPSKAFWLHNGTDKMPKREFFALSENDIKGITNIVQKQIEKILES